MSGRGPAITEDIATETQDAPRPTIAAYVANLYQYPIKGLSPQAEPSLQLVAGEGLPADRRFALALGSTAFDSAAPEPLDKGFFLMLRRDESLATLKTHYDEHAGHLSIVKPDGGIFEADLATEVGREATEIFFHYYLGEACEGRPRLVQATGHKFTDVSVISPAMLRAISLINLATVRDLAECCGKPLDPLRFRANICLDGLAAWDELAWVGREIAIGSAQFRGVLRTKRCAAINVDPGTGVRDTNLPKTLMTTYGHADCGIYLEVLSSGTIQAGDTVHLMS